jgi:hypothetical protein
VTAVLGRAEGVNARSPLRRALFLRFFYQAERKKRGRLGRPLSQCSKIPLSLGILLATLTGLLLAPTLLSALSGLLLLLSWLGLACAALLPTLLTALVLLASALILVHVFSFVMRVYPA